MPNFNNKGYGFLPVIAISALVITGSYFGYSWYMSNDTKDNFTLNNNEVSLNNNEDADVLQASTINLNYSNPANWPVVFDYSYLDPKNVGIYKTRVYIYGKDADKLNNAVNYFKDTTIYSTRMFRKPCFGIYNTNNHITDSYKFNVTKLNENLYVANVDIKTYEDADSKKVCPVGRDWRLRLLGWEPYYLPAWKFKNLKLEKLIMDDILNNSISVQGIKRSGAGGQIQLKDIGINEEEFNAGNKIKLPKPVYDQ